MCCNWWKKNLDLCWLILVFLREVLGSVLIIFINGVIILVVDCVKHSTIRIFADDTLLCIYSSFVQMIPPCFKVTWTVYFTGKKLMTWNLMPQRVILFLLVDLQSMISNISSNYKLGSVDLNIRDTINISVFILQAIWNGTHTLSILYKKLKGYLDFLDLLLQVHHFRLNFGPIKLCVGLL